MIDKVLEHLGHLHEQSSEWDAQSDRANQVAVLVETVLTEKFNLGIGAGVVIDQAADQFDVYWKQYLTFGRCDDGKFHLYVRTIYFQEQDPQTGEAVERMTLWSSCPRETRLLAYEHIPELLAQLSANLDERIERLRSSTQAIEMLVEFASKKGGKK
jgi:hypothetical protein